MKPSDNAKTILMILPRVGDILPRIIVGAQRVADARRWEFHPVVCLRDTDGSLVFERSPGGGTLTQLLSILQPDGVIVTLGAVGFGELGEAAREAGIPRLPVVHLGESSAREYRVFAHGDSASFAELALRELLRSGFDDYSFAPHRVPLDYSRARGEAFARLVALTGKRFHPFPDADESSRTASASVQAQEFSHRILTWLEALPKPCGIFAANDVTGEAVLNAAGRLGLDIPNDIAVVGVDDLAYICDGTHPTLSSVRRDLEGEGRAAAELVAEWIAHPNRPPAPRIVPAVSVTRRSSTLFSALRDRRVARAEEWIRVHACDEATSPADVVRQMGVSRTSADRLFRTIVGHSILETIQGVRIGRAMEKLRSGASPDIVAVECGFSSTLDFRRVFRKRVGTPVVRWLKSL